MRSMRLKTILLTILAALLPATTVVAQQRPRKDRRIERRQQEVTRRDGLSPDNSFSFVSSEMVFDGKVVRGAPYSATIVTEMVQTLADGARITRRSTAAVFRDSEGRTRREQSLETIGPFVARGQAGKIINIFDPVSGEHFSISPETRSARRLSSRSRMPRRRKSDAPRGQSLGTRTIEGVKVEGARQTITIPTGRIGNDRPIEIITEKWYSPELQVILYSSHTDPRIGVHTYRLTELSRMEPDAALFTIPPDYVIKGRK